MLGKAPLVSRDVMMRLIGSMSTTASCINMASNGDLPGMGPHIVGGRAEYTAGATRFRMSIHMSLVSVVAHTMCLQLSGFAQSPFSYSGCTRFAQSAGTSVFLMAISHRRAAKCPFRFSGGLQYGSPGSLSTPGVFPGCSLCSTSSSSRMVHVSLLRSVVEFRQVRYQFLRVR